MQQIKPPYAAHARRVSLLCSLTGSDTSLSIYKTADEHSSAVIFISGSDKMLSHKGTQTIKTERLLLREIKESDYRDIYEYAKKEKVAKYVSWNAHTSINDSKAVCKMWAAQYENGDKYHWAIVYNGKMIGSIEVVKLVDDIAYIGWTLDSAYWNNGIMTEAAAAVRDFLFEEIGVRALYACYITENIGSGRVMQKIGMNSCTPEEYYIPLGIKDLKTEADGMPLSFYSLKKEVKV